MKVESVRLKNRRLPRTSTVVVGVLHRLKTISCKTLRSGPTSCTKISKYRTTRKAGSENTPCAVAVKKSSNG